jgi:uncharacterized protein YjbI with pentapeptide repeats
MDARQAAAVWSRLTGGESLEGLGLPLTKAGRVDLQDLVAPQPTVVDQATVVDPTLPAPVNLVKFGNLIAIRGAHWKGIDFSGARLGFLQFFDSTIEDCSFDGATCHRWEVRGTTIADTSFRSADLREASLGGVREGHERNSFRQVDFTEADMRGTLWISCDMLGARFVETNLLQVDFQGTVFEECTFEGQLDSVIFRREPSQPFRNEAFPPNEMKGVDLRRAELRFVEFRGLDMDDVQWPESPDYLVVDDYCAKLDRALDWLKGRTDVGSRRLIATIGSDRKWAGANQKRGVLSLPDLKRSAGSDAAVTELLRAIGA